MGVSDTRNCQRCHCTKLPSTVKLGPSGWVISIGLRSSRRRSVVFGVVARPFRGQRHDAEILEVDDLAGRQIDVGDHALDRAGVAVVLGVLA